VNYVSRITEQQSFLLQISIVKIVRKSKIPHCLIKNLPENVLPPHLLAVCLLGLAPAWRAGSSILK
jgi:hypothetical protein